MQSLAGKETVFEKKEEGEQRNERSLCTQNASHAVSSPAPIKREKKKQNVVHFPFFFASLKKKKKKHKCQMER